MSRKLFRNVAFCAVMACTAMGQARAGTELIDLDATQEIIEFRSRYDGTSLVGVWATPDVDAQIIDDRGTLPAVILIHGYTSLFRTGHRPIDYNQGTTSEEDCDFVLDPADYTSFQVKSHYQDMIDFLVARGIAVLALDSFSGRCVESFTNRPAPEEVRAHSFKLAGDAYASLQHLNLTYPYVNSHRVAVVGVSYGGSAAILSVADVERMTTSPFAPAGYSDPSYGYEPPPTPAPDWRFAAAVSIGGGTGFDGYLGTNSVALGQEAEQATGLYGNHAPLLLLCGRHDSVCYEENGSSTYGKFDSLLLKAAHTTPEIPVDHVLYEDAGANYMIPTNDHKHPGNAAARAASFQQLETWLIPRIAADDGSGNTITRVPLPAGESIVSFTSAYDGIEILALMAVPSGNAVMVNGRSTHPAVVLLHGSGGLFMDSPLDFHRGDPDDAVPGNCQPVFHPDDYDQLQVGATYRQMIDFLVARGITVIMPDSFSGRCLEKFKDKRPPNDVYAHPYKRAHDAYETLRYLQESSNIAGVLGSVGVAGYSHGGTASLLALSDVDRMTTCPFAPKDYQDPSYGYEPPPTPTAQRRFRAGVNFYGGMGVYGYLGTNSVDHGKEEEQATGLYGNYAPLLMAGGAHDSIYYQADDPGDDEYGKLTSFLFKAAYTTPEVPVVAYVFENAGHQILNPSKDDDYPANAEARARIYKLVDIWFLPRLTFLP